VGKLAVSVALDVVNQLVALVSGPRPAPPL
jgi:hypothetical protein